MQIKSCNLVGWGLAIVALLVLLSYRQLGLLAVVLMVSFLFACGMTRMRDHTSNLSSEVQKR